MYLLQWADSGGIHNVRACDANEGYQLETLRAIASALRTADTPLLGEPRIYEESAEGRVTRVE